MQNVQWCFIEGTQRKYIITSKGKVFSKSKCNYLKPYINSNFNYKVNLTFYGYNKATRSVSIYRLLEKYFPEALNDKSLYCDIERKNQYEKLIKETEAELKEIYK